jgi:hypothetical protein
MKKVFLLISTLILSWLTMSIAEAGSLTLSWDRAHNPDFGFNLYFSHNQSPAALIYDATVSPSTRSTVLHNINEDGIYLIAVSAVNVVSDASGSHLIESNAITINVLLTNGIAIVLDKPHPPHELQVFFDPNGS